MYDKAPRIIYYTSGSTNEKVGPGSYNIAGSLLRGGESYAPFLSLRRRDVDNEELSLLPAPGQYNVDTKSKIIGGSCMKNKSVRFNQKFEDSPAPGAYDTDLSVKKSEAKSYKMDSIKILNKNRVPKAPSIPLQSESYGYEEDENGILVRQPVPDRDSTIGPAFYSPDYKTYNSSAKGHTFYKETERRLFGNLNSTPGPGSYETQNVAVVKPRNVNVNKEFVRKEYVQEKPPSPTIDYAPTVDDTKSKKSNTKIQNKVPFGIQSERFVEKIEAGPAPCDYQSSSAKYSNSFNKMSAPFGITATRFARQPKSYGSFYYPGESRVDRKMAKQPPKVGFNITSERFKDRNLKRDFESPGPGEYFKHSGKKDGNITSVFHSKSERFPKKQENEEVGPGSYNTTRREKKLPRRVAYGFDSSDQRFDSKFIKIMTRQTDSDVPSPSAYFIENAEIKGNMWTSCSTRFDTNLDPLKNTPGPGFYDLPESVMHTLPRKTHNINLANNVARSQK